jgi:hypothetical protein
MTPEDFRRMALSLPGAEEGSHMGAADFRVGGRIFATLASEKLGYGNLMLTVEQQAAFVAELPEMFLPIAGGWGRMGSTHIRLGAANEDVLEGALRAAWQVRVEKNKKAGTKRIAPKPVKMEGSGSKRDATKRRATRRGDGGSAGVKGKARKRPTKK